MLVLESLQLSCEIGTAISASRMRKLKFLEIYEMEGGTGRIRNLDTDYKVHVLSAILSLN